MIRTDAGGLQDAKQDMAWPLAMHHRRRYADARILAGNSFS